MKLEKAIEILCYYETDLNAWNDADNEAAVQLGIEALKRESIRRKYVYQKEPDLLPGETED